MIDITDDAIIIDEQCNWDDDSIEIYVDAQNLDVAEYNLAGGDDDIPVYQLTAMAGFEDEPLCAGPYPFDEYELGDTSWFTKGVNSYDDGGDETSTYYPQGTDISRAVIKDDTHWSFEVAFPWNSLDETPANILASGSMGFGIAYNDDDGNSTRESQPIWGDNGLDDLWHVASSIPSVALSTETVGGGGTPGDFDNDGDLDADDIDALSAAVRAGSTDSKFDVSGDGNVNADDRGFWVDTLRKTYFGDSNLDGEFNTADFVAVFTVGKYESGTPANWAEGDWNGDNAFDSSDFVAAFSAGGYENGPRAAVSAVPEPATMTLGLIGLGWMFGGMRRRRTA